MSLTLVILAAGAARRYGALKQLAPVGPSGEVLLEYSAYDAIQAGFTKVVLVIQKEHQSTFMQQLDHGLSSAVSLSYAHQQAGDAARLRDKPWGTAHAVLATQPHVGGAFAVINADDFYGREAYATLANFLRARNERKGHPDALPRYAVMGYPVGQTLSIEGPVSRAQLKEDTEGRLLEINELPAVELERERIRYRRLDGTRGTIGGDAPVSMNMWGFEQALFGALKLGFEQFASLEDAIEREFLLPEFINQEVLAARATVDVLRTPGPWTGLTFEADRRKTERFLADLVALKTYPLALWKP